MIGNYTYPKRVNDFTKCKKGFSSKKYGSWK